MLILLFFEKYTVFFSFWDLINYNILLRTDTAKSLNPDSRKKTGVSSQNKVESLENEMDGLVTRNELQTKTSRHERGLIHTPTEITGSETKQLKGALPEGFFDDKEADMLARGIKPVKPDVK